MKQDKRYIYKRKVKGYLYYYVQVPNTQKKAFSTANMSDKLAYTQAVLYRDEMLRISERQATINLYNQLNYTLDYAIARSQEVYNLSANSRAVDSAVCNYLNDIRYTPIKDITNTDILKVYNAVVDKPAMLQHVKGLLSRCYKVALLDNACSVNLASVVPLPIDKSFNDKQVITNDSDTFAIVVALLNARNRSSRQLAYLVLILKFTGMRPSEALALSTDKLNFVDNTITINCRIGSTANKTLQVVKPKTVNANRLVPIASPLRLILKELCQSLYSNYLFLDKNGGFLDIGKVSTNIKATAQRIGINFNLYMLRHTFIKQLIDNGVNQRTIMDIVGHASFNQSLYYSRSDDKQRNEAIKVIELH